MSLPRTPSFRLDGKRALVTGASRGIGLACAAALAEAGAHVICAARGQTALEENADLFRQKGWSAEALVLDVADVAGMADRLSSQPAFDAVVNSAGIARHAPALETSPEDYQAVMDINLRGAYFLAVEAARGMLREGKAGSIIQISSQMGHVGGIDRSVYCASKHAIEGMVKAMAIEWGPNKIRINSVCPTFIRTPFTEATFADPERVAWIESKIKLGRVGEVEDVMGAVVYLASEASAMVTGSSLRVDGGWTAG